MLKMTAKLKPPSHKRSLICPRSVAGASDFPPSRPCSSLSSTAGAKLSAVPWRTFPTAVHSYIAIRYCDRSTAVGSQVEVLLEFQPQLHLVRPGGIGRREVEPHFRILLQKLLHRLSLVGGQIVQHDVDLLRPPRLLHQLPQEDNKLRAGVPFRGLALHLAGFHIQGGIQRQCPVTVILETMPFGSPR